MSTRNVKITVGPVGYPGEILIDGQKVPNVRSFTLTADAGKLTTLTLEIINLDVEFEGEIDVTAIGDEYIRREVKPQNAT